jgi:hypothetical protein
MKTPVLLLVLAGAALLALPPNPPAIAQEEEDLTAGVRTMRAAFARAKKRSDNLDFAGAVRELDSHRPRAARRRISATRAGAADGGHDLGPGPVQHGQQQGRRPNETLLRLKPGYRRHNAAPKVIDLFDGCAPASPAGSSSI